ncbi:MAG: ATP synthase subunit C [Clostridia bacterium]
MNTFLTITLITVPVAIIMGSAFMMIKNNMAGKSNSRSMRANLATFVALIAMVGMFTFMASAEDAETESSEVAVEEVVSTTSDTSKGLGLLAAGLVTGLAGIGSGLAIAAGAPAAIAANVEDPKSFGKSIIFVALGESIAIFGVVISILILNEI